MKRGNSMPKLPKQPNRARAEVKTKCKWNVGLLISPRLRLFKTNWTVWIWLLIGLCSRVESLAGRMIKNIYNSIEWHCSRLLFASEDFCFCNCCFSSPFFCLPQTSSDEWRKRENVFATSEAYIKPAGSYLPHSQFAREKQVEGFWDYRPSRDGSPQPGRTYCLTSPRTSSTCVRFFVAWDLHS